MDPKLIIAKFGDNYMADDSTYVMGIDHRLTDHIARRFRGLTVLETCTGGGFSTIALARYARHVVTVEIHAGRVEQAKRNCQRAGKSDKITFICGDVLSHEVDNSLPPIDAAFLDPDWAVSGPDHVFRFLRSNTRPPSDELLRHVFHKTSSVALIQPPAIDTREFAQLPAHECESLFLAEEHALFCLYFGKLISTAGESCFRA